MKFSELEDLFRRHESALYSPSRTEVRFGCDCGCGGDSYTPESGDEEEKFAQQAIDDVIKFCAKYNIEYDGVV